MATRSGLSRSSFIAPLQVSSLPAAASSNNGLLVQLTTDNCYYQSNGSSWQNLTNPGGWLNVRFYGAKGDGTTDDLAAFNSAVSALGSNGGTIFVPPGTYLLSNTLEVSNKVVLLGAGRSTTVLRAHSSFPTTGAALIRLGPTSGLSFNSRCERMSLDCNNVAASQGVYSFQGQEHTGLSRVVISNFKDIGINLATGCANYDFDNLEIYPSSTGANKGFYANGTPGANILRRVTVGVSGLLTVGIHAASASLTVTDCHVENCTDGILFAGSQGLATDVSGPTATANVTNLVRMDGSSRYVVVANLTKNSATNVLKDDFFGKTWTDSFIQHATLGDAYLARLDHYGDKAGFFGTAAINRPTVSGDLRSSASLSNLAAALANLGLISNTTTNATPDTAWTAFPLGTGWADTAGQQVSQYRRVNDMVQLRGLPTQGAGATTTVGTLPTGFRPPATLAGKNIRIATSGSASAPARMDINTTGTIVLTDGLPGSGLWVALHDLEFSLNT